MNRAGVLLYVLLWQLCVNSPMEEPHQCRPVAQLNECLRMRGAELATEPGMLGFGLMSIQAHRVLPSGELWAKSRSDGPIVAKHHALVYLSRKTSVPGEIRSLTKAFKLTVNGLHVGVPVICLPPMPCWRVLHGHRYGRGNPPKQQRGEANGTS